MGPRAPAELGDQRRGIALACAYTPDELFGAGLGVAAGGMFSEG